MDSKNAFVYVVMINCDQIANQSVAVFSDLDTAQEFSAFLRKGLFGNGASHAGAVYLIVRPFNPKKNPQVNP